MGLGSNHLTFPINGNLQPGAWWSAVDDGWPLSGNALETGMPGTLPITNHIPIDELAAWALRCFFYGASSWRLLRGLLLVLNVLVVPWRRHEPPVGRSYRILCFTGKGGSPRSYFSTDHRRFIGDQWHRDNSFALCFIGF